jgi:hypothetical protein
VTGKTAAESFVWTETDRRREERACIAAERQAAKLRALIQEVADGEECLASEALTVEERQWVTNNSDRLVQALRDYDRILEKTPSPFRRWDLSSVMSDAIWAASVLTRFAPPVDAIARQERDHVAAHARQKRQEKPARAALVDAVCVVIGSEKVLRPSKLAAAILDEVNSRMTSAGHKEVKLDVVRRLLENPRSSRPHTSRVTS